MLLDPAEQGHEGTDYWERDAAQGSRALLEALCYATGAKKPPLKVVTISSPGVPDRDITTCKHCGSPVGGNRMLVATIQAAVAAYYQIEPGSMISARRAQSVSHPRQVAMYLAKELTPQSLPDIGRRFGGRDHTTVIHAIKQVKHRIATNPEIAADVELLRAKLCPESMGATAL